MRVSGWQMGWYILHTPTHRLPVPINVFDCLLFWHLEHTPVAVQQYTLNSAQHPLLILNVMQFKREENSQYSVEANLGYSFNLFVKLQEKLICRGALPLPPPSITFCYFAMYEKFQY